MEMSGAARRFSLTRFPEDEIASGFLFWLAVSNILLAPFWGWLFDISTPFDEQFQLAIDSTTRDRLQMGAGLIALCGIAAVFALADFTISKISKRAAVFLKQGISLISIVIALNYVRIRYVPELSYDALFALSPWLITTAGLAVLAATVFFWRRMMMGVCGFVWLSVPCIIVIVVNLLFGIYITAPNFASMFSRPDLQSLHQASTEGKDRVLWIIFDELDRRLGFETRPDYVEMPAFDAVIRQSFVATNARAPAAITWQSVPGMIIGEKVKGFEIRAGYETYVNWEDGRSKPLQEVGTIFSDASKMGVNTALFAHRAFRFCDLFNVFIQKCWFFHDWWLGRRNTAIGELSNVGDRVLAGTPLLERIVYGGIKPRLGSIPSYIEDTKKLEAGLAETVVDPNYRFIFAHVNIPHTPYIYDVDKNAFSAEVSGERAYLGALELADRLLGTVKAALESKGLWDQTSVILSSDHWWRNNEYEGKDDKWRVPLFVKLRNQKRAVTYDEELHPVRMRHLVRAILDGKVTDPVQIPGYLSP